MDIVARITELREKKGWSQYELAKRTGIAPNTVYSWTRTGSAPTLANIVKICEAMGIALEQFFCGIDCNHKLSEAENTILQEWFTLSELEKQAILSMIDVFKTLKS